MTGARDIGAWARLVLLGMVWGGSFIAIATALEDVTPISLAAGRLGLAAAALIAIALISGVGLPSLAGPEGRRVWRFAAAIAALSNAVPFMLLCWAQQHVAANVASVFMSLLPLVVLPLSALMVPGERLTLRKAAGFAAGTAGALVLIGPPALEAMSQVGASVLPELACLGVVIAYALGSITTKRAPQVHPIALSAAVMALAFLMVAPLALVIERPFALTPGLTQWSALLWLGLLSTAMGQVLLVQVLRLKGPPFLSQVNFMIPLWAMLFAAALLGEPVPLRAVAALALIFAGMSVAQGAWSRARGAATGVAP